MSTMKIDQLRTALIQAIEAAGFSVSGPTDSRAAEHGEPVWVCNAREALADSVVSDAEQARRGQLIADMFYLKKDLPDHPDRFKSTGGNKTALGVFRTMQRLIEDGE